MPPGKLLRAIQERRSSGSAHAHHSGMYGGGASNVNLEAKCAPDGSGRTLLPPLCLPDLIPRCRQADDIPMLIDHFLGLRERHRRNVHRLSRRHRCAAGL